MLGAGRYDRRVEFLRVTTTQDDAGVEVTATEPIAPAMANVLYGTGSERRTAAGTEAQHSVTVRVRSTASLRTVKVTDRLTIRGDAATYAVMGIVRIGPGASEIEFTATAALGAGA